MLMPCRDPTRLLLVHQSEHYFVHAQCGQLFCHFCCLGGKQVYFISLWIKFCSVRRMSDQDQLHTCLMRTHSQKYSDSHRTAPFGVVQICVYSSVFPAKKAVHIERTQNNAHFDGPRMIRSGPRSTRACLWHVVQVVCALHTGMPSQFGAVRTCACSSTFPALSGRVFF